MHNKWPVFSVVELGRSMAQWGKSRAGLCRLTALLFVAVGKARDDVGVRDIDFYSIIPCIYAQGLFYIIKFIQSPPWVDIDKHTVFWGNLR